MTAAIPFILAVICLLSLAKCEEEVGDRTVKVFPHAVNFHTALENCKYLDMELLVIHNVEEEEEAIALARKNNLTAIWLAESGIFYEPKFVSGERLTYTNWTPDEPDNAKWNEICALLLASEELPSGWKDITCDSLNAYFCVKIKRKGSESEPMFSKTTKVQ